MKSTADHSSPTAQALAPPAPARAAAQTSRRPRAPRPPRDGRTRSVRAKCTAVSQELREQIVALHRMHFGQRTIATKLGLGRKQVRTALASADLLASRTNATTAPAPEPAHKLDPFRQRIQEKVSAGLTVSRILREIRSQGYAGARTILANYVRAIRAQPAPRQKVWRRFETRPGEELQFDWSPYRVVLGGVLTTVHAFAATLGFSRKIHLRFYRDERESTLLEAHVHAFEDFGGVTQRGVYDRMATVVLGTVGPDRRPLWHARFLEFAHYYGYEPFLCKPRDPNRKGKDERVFWYQERDFLRGSTFDSLDDLNAAVRRWCDEVANRRVHGTTRRVPDEAWLEERAFLIALPDSRYPACDQELRQVGPDAVLWIRGTPYTIPAALANRTVAVRLYAEHFEVLNTLGQVAFSRRYVPPHEKGKLVIDPAHYEGLRPRGPCAGGSADKLEAAFLTRFPALSELCAGIHLRMKGLTHVHLRALWRLADRYGEAAFAAAAGRAQAYRRFDAQAVRRILEREHPLPAENEPVTPLTAAARVLVELSDVDAGALDDYAHLDHAPGVHARKLP